MNNKSTTFERPRGIGLNRTLSHHELNIDEDEEPEEFLNPHGSHDAFIIQPASHWLAGEEENITERLFGEFWYRDEICILFADTNVGKSILAVQIADALSRGQPVGAAFEYCNEPQKVLYFDFELSGRQFEIRYSSATHGRYPFSEVFYRLVCNPEATGQKRFASYADYINNAIENTIASTGAQILIIDNITCLRSGIEGSTAAVGLMRNLQKLKQKYGLSILVLAHTPKRNPTRPITRNDLQGSKMLINFADSVFAIGESQTRPGLRYLKQIKQRSGREQYGADNVCLCRIAKPHNFLKLDFAGYAAETAHLIPYTEQHRRDTETRVIQLHSQGRTIRGIAAKTGISYQAVFRVVKRLGRV